MTVITKRWYRSRRNHVIILAIIVALTYYLLSGAPTLDHELSKRYIESRIAEALKHEKGAGCKLPKLDPFAKEVTQFDKEPSPIDCNTVDWVKCYLSKCYVVPRLLNKYKNIKCTYNDIIYENDYKYTIGPPSIVLGDGVYKLKKSDHVKVYCEENVSKWYGHAVGFRELPARTSTDREIPYNVLILGFDSTAKNGFIRRLPKSYKVLKEELDAVILNGYNIAGDGTPAALFPILTGKTELELPDARKRVSSPSHLDTMPFIFYTLNENGYRTAYFEDMPWIGTFQYRFTGFRKQPADHYLRDFFMEVTNGGKAWYTKRRYCTGDTPTHLLMMNLTRQFFDLDSKKFIFTFVADITHDDFNMISTADENLLNFLRDFKNGGYLENTLVILMGDHGPRYAKVRNTLQGKQEERLPLMAFVLPKSLVRERPEVLTNLKMNSEVLTTPFDIHATLLDVIGLLDHRNMYKVPGSDLLRSLSLLEPVPASRSCSEAGIEPHWCACLLWANVSRSDHFFEKSAKALVDYINFLTQEQRSKCAVRSLLDVEWVMSQSANEKMLAFEQNKDADGYIGKFGAPTSTDKYFEVKVAVGPGRGVYEASMKYILAEDKFDIDTRDISRINAYGNEPDCVSSTHPHLNKYCYCTD